MNNIYGWLYCNIAQTHAYTAAVIAKCKNR